MKFISVRPNKSTATLALTLLVLMLGSGAVSALVSYKIGSDALKGVSQPEANPAKKMADNPNKAVSPQEFVPVDEKTILIQVYNRINSKEDDEKAKDEKQPATPANEEQKSDSQANSQVSLPVRASDRGVTFEVVKTSQQGGSLLLDVNLSNQGEAPVQFLYSFLEVKDSEGRSLSAIAEGLPGDLPSNGETFSGIVKIPLELVDEGQSISLNLTDYPDQKLKLNIPSIPVK